MPKPAFRFKQFTVHQDRCAMKVSTDGVLFGSWVNVDGAQRVLDIGTGTGLLALIAAQRNPQAHIDAVEIDDAAAQQAAENVAASPWPHRIRVHHMDIRRLHSADPFDLILCNPPYYPGHFASTDPRLGLAKHSGELQFPALVDVVAGLIAPQGRFAVIVPLDREQAFLNEALRVGMSPVRRCTVRYVAHRPPKRVLLELAPGKHIAEVDELTVEATGPFDYSPQYRALISDVMLNF